MLDANFPLSLAMHLGCFHAKPMTRLAIHQRMSPASPSFLLQVIDHLLAKHCAGPFEQLRAGPFTRVLIGKPLTDTPFSMEILILTDPSPPDPAAFYQLETRIGPR